MELPLGPPLDPGHGGDGLDAVDLLGPVGGHVPHFDHLVSASGGQPPPATERTETKTGQVGARASARNVNR